MPKIGFIGAGTIGSMLAAALHEHGYEVTSIASRTRSSAERLAARINATAFENPQTVADACEIIFITTPDDAIAKVARSIRWQSRHRVAHCSGGLTIEALQPVTDAGGQVAGFHPFQTMIPGTPNKLPGATVALEGEGPWVDELEQLAAKLGCPTIEVKSEDKIIYHLAGVFASNYVVTLYNTAVQAFEDIGIPSDKARGALLTLLKGTVANIDAVGLPQALTGPVARGDSGTIVRHLAALEKRSPELLPMYTTLGRKAVYTAMAKRSADPIVLEIILGLLDHAERAHALTA